MSTFRSWLTVAFAGFLFSTQTVSAIEYNGSTEGLFAASPVGAATYSIPIKVPPGINALSPELALLYNSQGGNGMLGVGWNLGGIDVIYRCNKTLDQDGDLRGVKFDKLDRFCMGGQRLVPVDGKYDTQFEGKEYRTEIESYDRIITHGTAVGDSGPAWFEVQTKDGRTRRYGYDDTTNNSVANIIRNPGSANPVTVARHWSISNITDSNDNRISFSYIEDSLEGIHKISKIEYFQVGTNYLASVNFIYSLVDREDAFFGYANGAKISDYRLLTDIEIRFDNQKISVYKLEYSLDVATRQSQVKKITKCNSRSSTSLEKCSYPVSFTWDSVADLFKPVGGPVTGSYQMTGSHWADRIPIVLDFNGDGFDDLLLKGLGEPWESHDTFLLYGSPTGFEDVINLTFRFGMTKYDWDRTHVRAGDFNGDGISDILLQAYDQKNLPADSRRLHPYIDNSFIVYGSKKLSGVTSDDVTFMYGMSRAHWSGGLRRAHVADFNGDGRSDILLQGANNAHDTYILYANASGFSDTVRVNNNKDFPSGASRTFPDGATRPYWADANRRLAIADYNGDGRADVIMQGASPGHDSFIIYGANYGFTGLKTINGLWGMIRDEWTAVRRGLHTGDFNGDGNVDIILQGASPGYISYILMGNGNGFNDAVDITSLDPSVTPNYWAADNRRMHIADYNMDGKSDIILQGINTDHMTFIFKGRYDGFEPVIIASADFGTSIDHWRADKRELVMGDYNGDGNTDILLKGTNTQENTYIIFAELQSNIISGVTTGLNLSTTIEYLPLNDSVVHTSNTTFPYPNIAYKSGLRVVSSVTQDNGVGGSTTTAYHYNDAKINLRGRDFLGFSKIDISTSNTTTDTIVRGETTYNIVPNVSYLLNGTIQKVEGFLDKNSTLLSNIPISSVENVWSSKTSDGLRPFLYKSYIREIKYQFPNSTVLSTAVTTVPSGGIDVYGNILKSTKTVFEGAVNSGGRTYVETTDSIYETTVSNWFDYSKVLETTVESTVRDERPKSDAGAMLTKSMTTLFKYDPNSPKLLQTIVAPKTGSLNNNLPANEYSHNLTATTTYTHNPTYGYQTSETVTGDGISTQRKTTTQINFAYTSPYSHGKKVYLVTTTNSLGHKSYKEIEFSSGNVISYVGPNNIRDSSTNVTTLWEYDVLGRKINETRADGNITQFSYLSCLDPVAGTNIVSVCAGNETNYTRTSSSGNPTILKFYDKLKRKVRTQVGGYLNQAIENRSIYNGEGRLIASTQDYYVGDSVYWLCFDYDEIGRTTEKYSPNASTCGTTSLTSTAYDGLHTTTTFHNLVSSTGDQVKQVWKNVIGLTVKIQDPDVSILPANNVSTTVSPVTEYYYGADGKLLEVKDENSNRIITNYDRRGRKLSTTDPDMGQWYYKYNAIGELLNQTDAKNQLVTMRYDGLGRMDLRTGGGETEKWYYDKYKSDGAGLSSCINGLGKLCETTSSNGYTNIIRYNNVGRPISNTSAIPQPDSGGTLFSYRSDVSYDAFGRVETTTYPATNPGSRLRVKNCYSDIGILTEVRSLGNCGGTGTSYWRLGEQIGDLNARGQVLNETLSVNIQLGNVYSDDYGRLKEKHAQIGQSGNLLQDSYYDYDYAGNLLERQFSSAMGNLADVKDVYTYDDINRIKTSVTTGPFGLVNAAISKSYEYDAVGNIRSKSDFGNDYRYNSTRPHAVTSVWDNGIKKTGYDYDANGFMFNSNGKTLTPTWFGKVDAITASNVTTVFAYDSTHKRISQSNIDQTTIYIGKQFEKISRTSNSGPSVEYKNYIYAAGKLVAIDTQVGAAASTSTSTIGDALDNNDISWDTGGGFPWTSQTTMSFFGGNAMASGTLGHSQESWLQTVVQNASSISFYWKVASEANYDYLRFFIDGVEQTKISGQVDWQQLTYVLTPGAHTITWKYTKDGSVSTSSDRGWVDKVQFGGNAVSAQIVGDPALGDAVDAPNLNWYASSNSNWVPQSGIVYNGTAAVVSGTISHNQNSKIETKLTGATSVSFYWKVASETNFDFLRFYIDGVEKNRISGAVGWQLQTYPLSSGEHTLTWSYTKDGSVSALGDKAWIDSVSFTGSPRPPGGGISEVSYVLSDHLGSVEVIIDPNGNEIERLSFDEFGRRRNVQGYNDPNIEAVVSHASTRGFTGHEHMDNVGFINMNARLYDPMLGRFMAADPTVALPFSTQGFNRYSYTDNNPLSRVDLSGYNWVEARGRVVAIIIAVVTRDAVWGAVAYGLYNARNSYKEAKAAGVNSNDAAKGAAIFGVAQGLMAYGILNMAGDFASGAGSSKGFEVAAQRLATQLLIAEGVKQTGKYLAARGIIKQQHWDNAMLAWQLYNMFRSKEGAICEGPNPINFATGEKSLTMLDHKSSGASKLKFERYYSSQATERTSLGLGWRSNFDIKLSFIDSAINGQPWSITYTKLDRKKVVFKLNETGEWYSPLNVQERIQKTKNGWQVRKADDRIESYNNDGRLIAIQERGGYTQALIYNSRGHLLNVRDNFGASLKFTYTIFGLLKSMQDPQGNTTYYRYNLNSKTLAKVFYPDITETLEDNPFKQYLYQDIRFPIAITGIVNELGQQLHAMDYDEQGRAILSELGDHAERVDIVFHNNRSSTVQTALGRDTTYFFDIDNQPRKIEGNATDSCVASNQAYTYDKRGNIETKTDWNDVLTRYQYNARNLETSRIEAEGTNEQRIITTSWHDQYRIPLRIVEPGKTTEYQYDNRGLLVQRTDIDTQSIRSVWQHLTNTYPSRSTQYAYNDQGLLIEVDGPRSDVNDVTHFAYDSKGNRTQVTNAYGHVSKIIEFDNNGRPKALINSNGVETQLEYNARGWLVSKTIKGKENGAEDATTRYTYTHSGNYEGQGQVATVTLPNGEEIFYDYDTAYRLVEVRNPHGERIHFKLDLEGNRIAQTTYNTNGELVRNQRRVFDELSRLLANIGADNQTTTYRYDKNGNLTGVTDPLKNDTQYAFDALNRLVATTDSHQGVIKQTYDAQNRLTSVQDQRELTTEYRYNGFGDKIAQISPDTGETLFKYNEAGQLIAKIDAREIETEYQYDALGRITLLHYPAANEEDIQYSYDARDVENGIGRLAQINDPSGSTHYRYNRHGQLKQQRYSIATTQYQVENHYNASGQLSSMVYPSGRIVDYQRDSQGRITAISTRKTAQSPAKTVVSHVSYLPFGPIAQMDYGNETSLNVTRDLDFRIKRLKVSDSDDKTDKNNVIELSENTYYDVDYDYDAVSNITDIYDQTDSTRNQHYDYDSLYRLIAADGQYGHVEYDYDSVGNRLARRLTGEDAMTNVVESYDYAHDSNRLNAVAQHSSTHSSHRLFDYDAVGNIVSDERAADNNLALIYGANNRLQGVSKNADGENEAAYRYNAKGQRVTKQVQQVGGSLKTIHFHYNSAGQMIAETDVKGNSIKEYVYAGSMRVAEINYRNSDANGQLVYIHNDHLGTPKMMMDEHKTVVWRDNVLPFGQQVVSISPEIQKMMFPGQYLDGETGFSQNYFRDYDSSTGRYVQSDPIGLKGGVNTFGYVVGNPLSFIDLFGLEVRKSWTYQGMVNAVNSVNGMSNYAIASRFTPTPFSGRIPSNGNSMLFRNLDVVTSYGMTDIDWALTLTEISNATGVSPRLAYAIGKFGWAVTDEGGALFLEHMSAFSRIPEENAIRMANDLVDNKIKFGEVFYQCP